MDKTGRYFAVAGAVIGGVSGFYLLEPVSEFLAREFSIYQSVGVIALFVGVFAGLFYLIGPPIFRLIKKGVKSLESQMVRMAFQDILVGVAGLIIGLIIANLIAPSLGRIPVVGSFLPVIALVILGYIGISVALSKKEDILSVSSRFRNPGKASTQSEAASEKNHSSAVPKILDTSSIIDGRIADICKTGFVEGPIVIPDFILDELRHIADSSDNMKRNKGRRGLDILNVMQKELPIEVSVVEWPEDTDQDVDVRLLKMAMAMDGVIVTTDFNLAKIAELQEVGVLNINLLANALKPIVATGEEMVIRLIKEGKEPGQGVGYLEDGTMVVVEDAKKLVGEEVQIVVTNCHTTPAGRMIFAKLKSSEVVERYEG